MPATKNVTAENASVAKDKANALRKLVKAADIFADAHGGPDIAFAIAQLGVQALHYAEACRWRPPLDEIVPTES